jgi:hypothetical protein
MEVGASERRTAGEMRSQKRRSRPFGSNSDVRTGINALFAAQIISACAPVVARQIELLGLYIEVSI